MSTTEPPLWMALDPADPDGLRRWTPRLDRHVIHRMWTQGVLEGLTVTPTSPAGWNVRVSEGWAVVEGADQADQGSYLVHMPTPTTLLAIPPAGTSSTTYLIGLVVRDSEAGGPAGDNGELVVGTYLPATAIELARITVNPTDVAVTAPMISTASRAVGSVRGAETVTPRAWYWSRWPSAQGINDFARAVWAPMVGGTITNALPGDYLIGHVNSLQTLASTSAVYLRTTVNNVAIAPDHRATANTVASTFTQISPFTLTAPGTMDVRTYAYMSTQTGRVINQGMHVFATYLGRRS